MKSDILVSKIIFAQLFKEQLNSDDLITEESEADAILEDNFDNSDLLPLSWFIDNREKLWSNILNSPIPANGYQLENFVDTFSNSASNAVENLIRKAYANKLTVAAALTDIVGTPSKYRKDGALTKIYQQHEAVVSTSYQHITAILQAALASSFFDKYKWVSVLDDRTTEICINRNGKIYSYGSGPLPPAHIRCRSKTIPWFENGGELIIPTFYIWIKQQPKAVQDAILGKDAANKLSSFNSSKEMNLDDFESSISIILTR
jgi:SPP1 gp7 family putative phage head morphogenesis protein